MSYYNKQTKTIYKCKTGTNTQKQTLAVSKYSDLYKLYININTHNKIMNLQGKIYFIINTL